jgi:hypothetical protein
MPEGALLFRRSEMVIDRLVYGLILTLATLGELIRQEVTAGLAVAWLLGAGAVLLAAHLFSGALAHVAKTQTDPDWSEMISVGRQDVSVIAGAVGAALIMAIAAAAELDAGDALVVCIALGLVAVAALSFHATLHHRLLTRVLMSSAAAGLGAVIVFLENVV